MNDWITADAESLIEMAAAFITATAYLAVAERGRFNLVLAGGNTPRRLYRKLDTGIDAKHLAEFGYTPPGAESPEKPNPAAITLPWRSTVLFQGDERYVPVSHPDSNYGMARDMLIRPRCTPPGNIFRMPVESGNPAEDALRYETMLRGHFRLGRTGGMKGFPPFDLVMLGLGSDGHTASLFPHDRRALEERRRWVIDIDAPPEATPPGKRLTLTLPAINHASNVMFLVPADRYRLARSIHNGEHPELPAGMVRPVNGKALWFVAEP
jgi:6-phosphogluconolactonase